MGMSSDMRSQISDLIEDIRENLVQILLAHPGTTANALC